VTTFTKKEIRKKVLNLLRNQKEEERLRRSLVILEKLFALPQFQSSKTILFYASFDGEVETFEMMIQAKKIGKKIALPTILVNEKMILPALFDNFHDLETGPYGIKQPRVNKECLVAPEKLDLCVVPGVAFDRRGQRLGRGAGYYDRFLSSLPKDTPTVGLAFDFQMFDCLPGQPHDVPVSCVITN
jgi:5-formyltetrahydrofolate cyclo-ligase